MSLVKRIFTASTGYWLHKVSTLPVGANLFIDVHKRIKYGAIDIMFDVGANSGQTWAWLRKNEKNGTIYCFEPVANTFDKLKENTKKDKNCIIENIAFGGITGKKDIKLYEDEQSVLNSLNNALMNESSNAKTETIKVETIDKYCEEKKIRKIDFLKIDTEGYEINVLEGARKMLTTSSISFIYCEVGMLKKDARHTNFSLLTEWLAEEQYYFFGLYQLVSNGWKTGDYFGNALYVHKDIFNPFL